MIYTTITIQGTNRDAVQRAAELTLEGLGGGSDKVPIPKMETIWDEIRVKTKTRYIPRKPMWTEYLFCTFNLLTGEGKQLWNSYDGFVKERVTR